jgi:hypothetical protein
VGGFTGDPEGYVKEGSGNGHLCIGANMLLVSSDSGTPMTVNQLLVGVTSYLTSLESSVPLLELQFHIYGLFIHVPNFLFSDDKV